MRNDHVFINITHDPFIVLLRCISWATNYANLYHLSRITFASLRSSYQFLLWQTPPTGWICLHTDCVVNVDSGLRSIGGLFRDYVSSWISGFGRSIGLSDALTAELWAIHDGLELVWNNSFLNLQVRSDCSMIISLVMDPNAANISHAFVHAIATLRRRAWSLELIWIPRETNRPVDSITKQVPPDHYDLLLFD
ncbi:hypothetical protein V6N13_088670 [Hibiscus sabdariffa]